MLNRLIFFTFFFLLFVLLARYDVDKMAFCKATQGVGAHIYEHFHLKAFIVYFVFVPEAREVNK